MDQSFSIQQTDCTLALWEKLLVVAIVLLSNMKSCLVSYDFSDIFSSPVYSLLNRLDLDRQQVVRSTSSPSLHSEATVKDNRLKSSSKTSPKHSST